MPDVEEHLRRAMEDGTFDNLPGKGQPLQWEENPFEEAEWRLAFHLLRANGYTLPWIELRQEIETELNTARQAIRHAWNWRNEPLLAADMADCAEENWQRAWHEFEQQVARLNRRISDYNLQVPLARFQLRAIDLRDELNALCNR